MAHKPEVKNAARSAYVYDALTLEQIAERHGISVHTVGRWKREARDTGDDWDRARGAARLSGQGSEAVTAAVLEDFVLLFQSTIADLKADKEIKPIARAEAISRLTDAYNKTMSAAAKSSPKLNKLAVAMEILQYLTSFIREDYPHLVESFAEMLESFGRKLSEVL